MMNISDPASPKSVSDYMRSKAIPQKPADYIMGRELKRKVLSRDSKYHFCPYCVQRIKRAGQSLDSLEPMWGVTRKELYKVDENKGITIITNTLECPVCKELNGKPKEITEEDFCNVYAKVPEQRVKFIDLSDEKALANF